jgi:arsenite methyltransferase
MSTSEAVVENLDLSHLRSAIQEEYETVALQPQRGFHFHTGRPLAQMLGYDEGWLAGIPESALESFAGTGNPFRLRVLQPGENVVDVGSGAGLDSLIAARMVAPGGKVVGVDMTQAMLAKASRAAQESEINNVEFRQGYAEALPVEDGWADVVISNGVLNLVPDKSAALREMGRALKPGGRLQIGDILVQKEVPESAKRQIDLWTG